MYPYQQHPQVGGCYNHPERLSVTVCSKCGVGLCKDCAKDGGLDGFLCPSCKAKKDYQQTQKEWARMREENIRLKADYQEYRKWLKERGGHYVEGKEFLRPGIIGLIFALVVCGIALYFGPGDILRHLAHLKEIGISSEHFPTVAEWAVYLCWFVPLFLGLAYAFFSIPFAYYAIKDYFTPKNLFGFFGLMERIIRFLLTVPVSVCFGWAFFTFFWVRYLVRKRRAKKAQQVQEDEGQGPPTPTA